MIDNKGIPLPHLRAWRKRALLSQQQLATLAGLSKYTIMNIENGTYHGAQYLSIHKLAHALDITPQQLIEEVPV